MSARDLLSDARALLGAASSTSDPDLRILYTGKARSTYAALLAEAEGFRIVLEAAEGALPRPHQAQSA